MPEGFNNGGNHKKESVRAQRVETGRQDNERFKKLMLEKEKVRDKRGKKKNRKDSEGDDEDE